MEKNQTKNGVGISSTNLCWFFFMINLRQSKPDLIRQLLSI